MLNFDMVVYMVVLHIVITKIMAGEDISRGHVGRNTRKIEVSKSLFGKMTIISFLTKKFDNVIRFLARFYVGTSL